MAEMWNDEYKKTDGHGTDEKELVNRYQHTDVILNAEDF